MTDDKTRSIQTIRSVVQAFFKGKGRPMAEMEDFLFALNLDEMEDEQLLAVIYLAVYVKVEVL